MTAPTRMRHVTGAWLLSMDLRDAPDLPAARLVQHHVAAHRTWGCSAGLEVAAWGGRVTVTRGFGIDRCGRVVVLAATRSVPVRATGPLAVVLHARGQGPQGVVAVREAGRLADLDIPLATVTPHDDGGDDWWQVEDGDGHRQWLRRPGPIRRLAGTVPRGAPATGRAAAWEVEVDLGEHRLPADPVVVGTPAGPAPAGTLGTTVEVRDADATGFVLAVRSRYPGHSTTAAAALHTAPHAVSWLALVPAPRPTVPTEEWFR